MTRSIASGGGSGAFPDGLEPRHADDGGAFRRHASPLSVLLLGTLLAAALAGLFGGGRSKPVRVDTAGVTLIVTTPRTLRNGIFFETRVSVEAHRSIADVVIAAPPALWRDQTINTAVPQADKEESKDGQFRFHYGPLAAGKELELKFDGQINPPLTVGTRGEFRLFDGDRPLATVPLRYRVWP